jgi:hypothetical protein
MKRPERWAPHHHLELRFLLIWRWPKPKKQRVFLSRDCVAGGVDRMTTRTTAAEQLLAHFGLAPTYRPSLVAQQILEAAALLRHR